MKRFYIAASLALAASMAAADTPTVHITAPSTPIVYVPSFPAAVTIGADITHDQGIDTVHPLRLEVNDNALVDVAGNAFNAGVCTSEALSKFDVCSVAGNIGSVSKRVAIEVPGQYAVTVAARHKNALGEDESVFEVVLLQVEYPAPPSVANAYINRNFAKLKASCRGGIISQVADNHAKASKYGLKGGPYDTPLIESDVLALKSASGC